MANAKEDKTSPAHELADRLARVDARAEDLIAANRRAQSPELREAQLKEPDPERTAELDWAKAAKAADLKEDQLVDAAVRGEYVVLVYEDDAGRQHKAAVTAEDAGVEPGRRNRSRRTGASGQETPKKGDSDKKSD